MRRVERGVAVALILAATAGPVLASDRADISVPAGRLRNALTSLAVQEDITVGLDDAELAELPTPALHGRMGADTALRRLLAKLPARAVRIDARTYRIVAKAGSSAKAPVGGPPIRGEVAVADVPPDIVVTASKRGTSLASYPGSATVLGSDALRGAGGLRGSEAIVALVPAVTSTNLGPGRNKLFIRGVADSSFNGPSQATVGQYLGDMRLNYNAPDPDLDLYDVGSVEVLEGPQGTLYGAGSLGGIVRVVPNPVNFDGFEGSAAVGLSTTAHGNAGSDLAAMLNVPVTANLGVRGVAYRSVEGGWIDDDLRGLGDVNRTSTRGGRLTVAFQPAPDWTVELGGVLQDINSDDGQYAERGLPPLTRRSTIFQPFDNDYALGNILVSGAWDGMKLIFATGVVRHDVLDDYDFTPSGGPPTLYRQDNGITLVSSEARLSRSRPDGTGWLVGLSGIVDDERLTRSLGTPASPMRIAGVRNGNDEAALFGELTVKIGPRLLVTAGGRFSYAHLRGHGLDEHGPNDEGPDRDEHEFLPAVSATYKVGPRLLLFGRYQEGFRPGGLSVAADGDDRSIERFQSDTIGTFEAGIRLQPAAVARFDGQIGFSYAHWEHIQADLVDSTGLPFTANIGTGRILGFEVRGRWRPAGELRLELSAFFNDSELVHPAAGFAAADGADLPNIAELGGRAGASYAHRLSETLDLTVTADVRYVGRSRLGVGPTLDLPQGRYVDSEASVRVGRGRFGLTAGVTNLLDTKGNRFSFGDPYSVADGRQITPLRPRTIRVGLDAAF